ncbi:DUF2339 domain-containing protein [Xenorhabdus szentirmaii]|uniref:DUF2339 domain-containing protein n=1 Tax=Xenorhabdus szentirmaii TaxID=290112 RepID=UPI002B415012|nr:DUF2339 domain-containing protein [Xenorhabdus sp. 5]
MIVAIIISPIVAFIALRTGNEAKDEIKNLKNQIAQLKQQVVLSNTEPSSPSSPPVQKTAVLSEDISTLDSLNNPPAYLQPNGKLQEWDRERRDQARMETQSELSEPEINTTDNVFKVVPDGFQPTLKESIETISTNPVTNTEPAEIEKSQPPIVQLNNAQLNNVQMNKLPTSSPSSSALPTQSPQQSPQQLPQRSSSTTAPETPPSFFSGIISWFLTGNPVAKLGVLLLFFGIAYLLKYSVERNVLPIELRLASAALGSLVLLGIGWWLRHKQPLYALLLQGGSIGGFYITVFATFRLYLLLPHTVAFALMLIICAASVALAVLQRAQSLAMLACIGGYLAPLLLSTGGGSHIALFSYYLLISCGILVISLWQSWRSLNLLGFIFTFGIGTFWGSQSYQSEYYLSCQIFLIINLVLFSLLTVLFGLKNRPEQKMAVDGTLLFGPPVIGFTLQYAMTIQWEFGPAFSALGFGLLYLGSAWATLRRFPQAGKRIAMGYLALGGCFVTLSIPLALSAQWTALAWSLEGLGILWCGLLQNQRRFSYTGNALLVMGLISQLFAYPFFHAGSHYDLLFTLLVMSLCFICAGALWRHYRLENTGWKKISFIMMGAGIAIWFWWVFEMVTHLSSRYSIFSEPVLLLLLIFSLSVLIWRWAALRLMWPELRQTVWLLWPIAWLSFFLQWEYDTNLLSDSRWSICWLVALAISAFILKRDARTLLTPPMEKLAHLLLLWLGLALIGSEVYWQSQQLPWGMEEWGYFIHMNAMSLVILLLWVVQRYGWWPLSQHAKTYWLGILPLAFVMFVMLVYGNDMDGQVVGGHYLPLVNPLEEASLFGILMLYIGLHHAIPFLGSAFSNNEHKQLKRWVTLGLLVWWANGALLRALSHYADITWRFETLWASRLIQAIFAVVWALAALVCMLYATRTMRRKVWFAGAGVLGIVIVKLFLVDSAVGGGLARAFAFLGVAVLLLIIGYFSPIPPLRSDKQEKTA